MEIIRESVTEKGYAITPLDLSMQDRQDLAQLGNTVIDIALEDNTIREALTHNPHPHSPGKDVTGMFIGAPRVALDDSVSFHSGWQTEAVTTAKLGHRAPKELQEFFSVQKDTLSAITNGWKFFFNELFDEPEASALNQMIDHQNRDMNNHHIRVVRYPNALGGNRYLETFSAHGDLSVVTSEIYSSDPGHLRVAPVDLDDIKDNISLKRYCKYVQHSAVARSTHISDYDRSSEAISFLGFAAANVSTILSSPQYDELKASYHLGLAPDPDLDMSDGLFGRDRVAVVAFGHPHYLTPYTTYRTSTKEACRPEQVYDGRVKPFAQ